MARHDETEMTLLNSRNIEGLHEALKLERGRVDKALDKAEGAMRTVATLQKEIAELRVQLANILNMR